jgi:hypothetical protein
MDVGIIAPDERVDLLDGIVMTLPTISDQASATVALMQTVLTESIGAAGAVVTQTPVILAGDSQIVCHLALLEPGQRFYANEKPTVADVRALIDVAENSQRRNPGKRLNLCARARVPAYWFVNLRERAIHVYREPADCAYRSSQIYQSSEYFDIPGASTLLTVQELLGA